MENFCRSHFLHTNQTLYTYEPILTKCFREIILVWLPCGLFLLTTPFECYYLRKSSERNIPWNRINIAKLFINVTLIILCLTDICIAVLINYKGEKFEYDLDPVDIYSSAIKFTTFLLVFVLTLLNRINGLHTSGCQFLFWLLLVFCSIFRILGSNDTVEKDNLWSKYKNVSFMIFFVSSISMLIINCFADKKPRESTFVDTENVLPESCASFLSRITYHYFDRLAWHGYSKTITLKELWPLRPNDCTSEIMRKFIKNQSENLPNRKELNRVSKDTAQSENQVQLKIRNVCQKATTAIPPTTRGKKNMTISIMPPIIKSFAGSFLCGSLMKLITDLLTFVHPQILGLIIGYVEASSSSVTASSVSSSTSTSIASQQPQWLGISYAIILLMTASTQTIVLCQYFHRMFLVGLHIRSAVISTIFRKALTISHAARRHFTTGEIINLMAVDAQRFLELTTYLNMLWSAPLQIGLALYFLWQQLGPSVLSGLAVMIVLIPINAAIASRIKSIQIKQMKYKDERVKLMNEILGGIKTLKLNAWEDHFEKLVLQVRDKEVETLKSTAYLNSTSFFFMFCASVIVSLASLATYVLVDENNVLDATKTFVSLSLFNVLNFPLNTLPMLISNIVQARVSVKRINKFINSKDFDTNNVQRKADIAYALIIKNGNFFWSAATKEQQQQSVECQQQQNSKEVPLLKEINMNVKKHSLCALLGAVGAGKSSLLQVFLGEMDKLSGYVNIDGSLAYVSQQAWLQNASIRDNILFGRTYERERYRRVLKACALNADLAMFSAGDHIEIGERGINLSGGQKQRISLARAVYLDADIYLLDDPLSAVDAHVGRHIFDHVIGPHGILANKTRLLVTHSLTFLPEVDNIYFLRNGQINECGNYEDFLLGQQRGNQFAEFLQQRSDGKDNNESGDKCRGGKAVIKTVNDKDEHFMKVDMDVRLYEGNANDGGDDISIASGVNQNFNDGRLIRDEQAAEGEVRLDVYKHYIKGVGLLLSTLTLFLMLISQLFQIGSNLWLTKWSNDNRVENDSSIRNTYLSVFGAFGFIQAISSYLATLALSIGCVYCARDLHATLFSRVMRWPMGTFDTTPLGRILNRFSKDVDTVDNLLPQNWRMILMQVYMLLGTIAVISISTPIFMTVVVPIGLIYMFVQRIYIATSRQLNRLESVSRSPIYSHFTEAVFHSSSIRAYTAQERFMATSDRCVDQNHKCQYHVLTANRWLSVRLEMIGNLIIFFAALFAILGGQKNSGLVGLSISYALQITDTLKWIVRLSSDIENNVVAVERIKEYSNYPQEAERYFEDVKLPKNWPSSGRIVFENLKVRYRDELDFVLSGIDLTIESGEKVGIIGRTGAGKSSMVLSLFRLVEPAAGRIIIDGVDITSLGLHQLRTSMTIISQDPVLYSATLRYNIDLLGLKTDEEIWTALEKAHLLNFVKSLPCGLQYKLVEGGENLSLGQRQLVCLARAVLNKTKILILDEATAAIDLETDKLIQETIRTQFGTCTVISIAHRLNTVLDYDKIVVLEKGRIVEKGSPVQLLANNSSIFYNMAQEVDCA